MSKKKKQTKQSIFYPTPKVVAGWVLLILAIYGTYRGSNYLMYRTGLFKVEKIMVSGNRYIDGEGIVSAAKIDSNQAMYKVDPVAVTETLLKNRYFRGVSVTRVMPSTIMIDVQEREPVLYLVDKTIYMVDEEGTTLKKLPTMPMGKCPIVTGVTLKQVEKDSSALVESIEIVKKIREVDASLFSFISEINIGKDKHPELVLIKGAARVKIGTGNYYQRLFILSQFFEKQPVVEQLPKIKQIDLTFADRIVIQKKS
jgi:cell division septal protein FtsQ